MPEKDYYDVLGVSPDASHEDIRKAYRRLAKEHHPDRQKGSKAAEERFKEITGAYSVLGDPKKRAQYDQLRQAGMHGGAFGGFEEMFGGAQGAGRGRAGGVEFEGFGGLGDLFSRIFGGGRSHAETAPPQRGNDVVSTISVPFETAAQGGKMSVRIPRQVECAACRGTGAAPGSRVDTCPQCRGSGQILTGQGAFSVSRPCPACFGRGKIVQQPCGQCRGAGVYEKQSTVEVKIPAGIEDGRQIRLAGLGEPGTAHGRAGDLLLEVRVQPHKKFTRKGRDLYSGLALDMVDAALGTEVDVRTMHGLVALKVPPGVQPGQKMRIPGHGLRTSDGREGDHYVELQVRIPKELTEEQRKLLERLRRTPSPARS
ncbi:MAG: molecular chaperone DnaJ [Candidatus Brocadiaceae bacterium]|nr:molecular chaperone DnaJ [Candidatus Brocadiaceae bacterium]